MFETKLVWFLSAAILSLGGALVAFEGYPGNWQMIVAGIVAVGQGLLAYRAFVAQPPKE